MKNIADSISLQYGDAKISFYNIKVLSKTGKSMLWHSHRHYEIHLVSKAAVAYRFQEHTVTVKEDEMLIIPPNVEHDSLLDDNDYKPSVVSMSLERVNSDQKFFDAFAKALDSQCAKPFKFSADGVEALGYTELYRSVLGVLKLKQVAAEFVNRLFSALLSNNNPAITSGKALAVLIDTLVNREGTTLDDIVAATNYSKRHLTRRMYSTIAAAHWPIMSETVTVWFVWR